MAQPPHQQASLAEQMEALQKRVDRREKRRHQDRHERAVRPCSVLLYWAGLAPADARSWEAALACTSSGACNGASAAARTYPQHTPTPKRLPRPSQPSPLPPCWAQVGGDYDGARATYGDGPQRDPGAAKRRAANATGGVALGSAAAAVAAASLLAGPALQRCELCRWAGRFRGACEGAAGVQRAEVAL